MIPWWHRLLLNALHEDADRENWIRDVQDRLGLITIEDE